MKHLILTAAAALMLLSSCNQEKEWSIYDGDYTVDANTVITLNGKDVLLSDYENASISIRVLEGNRCDIILENFITGQPEITVQATLAESGTKATAGAAFSGSAATSDRTVNVEGVTGESTIASISIAEEITVDGIPGKWAVSSTVFSFSHPELQTIDFSEAFPGVTVDISTIVDLINGYLAQAIETDDLLSDFYLELSKDGSVSISDAGEELDGLLCYYVRPEENSLCIHLRKSVVETLFNNIMNEPDIMNVISMLGFSSLIENPQSMNIALYYTTGDNTLNLTATQVILDPYEEQLAQPLSMLKALLETITYENAAELLAGIPELGQLVNADNFPILKSILIDTLSTLTDGQAEYSLSTELIPYTA